MSLHVDWYACVICVAIVKLFPHVRVVSAECETEINEWAKKTNKKIYCPQSLILNDAGNVTLEDGTCIAHTRVKRPVLQSFHEAMGAGFLFFCCLKQAVFVLLLDSKTDHVIVGL